jgi:hypothetical protein
MRKRGTGGRGARVLGLGLAAWLAQGGCGGSDGSGGPLVNRFTATPDLLPMAGGTATLIWDVSGADTVEIDNGIGPVAGAGTRPVAVTATTVFQLTAKGASGTVTSVAAAVVGYHPDARLGDRYAALVAPVGGEVFEPPTSLRLVGVGHDPNVYTNSPTQGHGANAAKLQFFVDDDAVLEEEGSQAEYAVFKGFVSGVGAGLHRMWARAIFVNPPLVLDSFPAMIDVHAPPTYGRTIDLSGDLVVGGASYDLSGTASVRVRVNGNGHRIVSAPGAGGLAPATSISFQYVDFYDVGDRSDTSTPGFELSTSTGLVLVGCNFDGSNPLDLGIEGSAPATISGNTFRSNMRQPLGQYPDGMGGATGGGSFPVLVLHGASTAPKTFQGNNVGAGWVSFENTQNWLVGGDDPAQSNVLIGPRVGLFLYRSDHFQIRHNYTHHVYYGGWSQGSNLELGGAADAVTQHNIIIGSSWPVRGVATDVSYNLILQAGHQWLWADHDNANVHHNLFIGGDNDVGGIMMLYGVANVTIRNNTIDTRQGGLVKTALDLSEGTVSLTRNVVIEVPGVPVMIGTAGVTADYNVYWHTGSPVYSDNRTPPPHDLVTDPLLAAPGAGQVIDYSENVIWTRSAGVLDILKRYKSGYTPRLGSPLVDVQTGHFLGAIGEPSISDPEDLFAK